MKPDTIIMICYGLAGLGLLLLIWGLAARLRMRREDEALAAGRDDLMAVADAIGVSTDPRQAPGVVPAAPITLPHVGVQYCPVCGEPMAYGIRHYCRHGADYRPQRTVA